MAVQQDDDLRVAEQATHWFTALLEGDEQRADFFKWLEESPRHVDEFMRVADTAAQIVRLSPDQLERIERLAYELGTHQHDTTNIVPISPRAVVAFEAIETTDAAKPTVDHAASPNGTDKHEDPTTAYWYRLGSRGRSARWGVRAAAIALVGLGAFLWLNSAFAWRTYSTGLGEQRLLTLPDGSTVAMNTDSEISIRITESARTIRLARGEAMFTVAHDAKRPFDVRVARTVIRAVGTEFDVYRQSGGTRVAVINGLVQVSTGDMVPNFPDARAQKNTGNATAANEKSKAQLSATTHLVAAGEAAMVSVNGEISRRPAVDPDKAVAWRRSRLVFENETLTNIAAEFNRYNSLKIRVVGKAAEQHFSGTFNANAPEAVMHVLAADTALQVERLENEVVIRSRNEAEADSNQMQ